VRTGGGENHRKSLSDAILLKDNHLEALRWPGGKRLVDIIATLRKTAPETFLEVEVNTREEYLEALESEADCILLDNFDVEGLRWAVVARAERGQDRPLLEASGGLRLESLREVAETGIERLSVGALTHSARALDIGLDLVRLNGDKIEEAAPE
jgi:nicotinate-nucleotide pyrophosphorylase (carboxylating)